MRHGADIAVIGAGPAGARAAELLATLGARVVLIDAKAPWEKPCGGGLTPSAFREIPELEELKPLARTVTQVRVELDADRGFSVGLDHPMWILSRRTLGEWQLERALKAGARHLPVRVRTVHRRAGAWHLETADGDLTASTLIGADGAASLVRRVAAPMLHVELAPARVAYPRGSGPTPDAAILRFYAGTVGYLWDFPRPDHRSVGIMASDGGWQRSAMDGEIDGYRASSQRCSCSGLDRAGAVIGTAQLGHGDYRGIAGDDFALLGDAAGLADPFTGEGIQNALRSARLLAEAWTHGGLTAYPALARRAFEKEFRLARRLRRLLFDTNVGVGLVEKAADSRMWYAAVAAVVNGLNEHENRAHHVLGRWTRACRSLLPHEVVPNGARLPVPCDRCSHGAAMDDTGTSTHAA